MRGIKVTLLSLCILLSACASTLPVPVSLTALMQIQLRERAGLHAGDWEVGGDSHAANLARLEQWAEHADIIVTTAPISRKQLLGHTQYGGYTGWVILISRDLTPNGRLYTLLHELGHVLGPQHLDSASAEVVAEMVAAMVCERLGLDVRAQTAAYLTAHVPLDMQSRVVQLHGERIDNIVTTLATAGAGKK